MRRVLLWMPVLVVPWMGACGSAPVLPSLAPAPVDVEVQVERPAVATGEPIVVEVTRWTSPDWALPPVGPVSETLTTAERSVDGPSVVGNRSRTVVTFELSGEDGSHVVVVPPVEAAGPGDQTRTIEPSPVFVDIGTAPAPLAGLVGPEAVPDEAGWSPWVVAGAVGGGLIALGLAAWLVVRARRRPALLPDPADVVARAAWQAARQKISDDHALALALSQIFRQFLQEVTGFPMLARTTREIVRYLEQEELVADAMRQQARRVLDATDRLKFAREGGGEDFFHALETDFLAVVEAMSTPTADEGGEADDVGA